MHQLTDEQLAIITMKKIRRARCLSFRGSNRRTAGPDSNVELAFPRSSRLLVYRHSYWKFASEREAH
jgi:hypothetical protein